MDNNILTINDSNWQDHINPVVDGETKMHGLIPRDFAKVPHGSLMYAQPFDIPLIPESEWQDRLNEQIANKSRLCDIRDRGMNGQRIPSRDQNGKGYCWAHSPTSAALLLRALMGEPYADLSAFAVACTIKNYRDQGGFGAESLQFIAERGIPTSKTWPQKSMSRSNDNAATWAEAAQNKFTRWMDLDPRQMKAQLVTCFLLNIPVIADYNRWSHSVCACYLASLRPLKHGIWNSWTDNWGTNGMGELEGESWLPNSAVAARLITPALA